MKILFLITSSVLLSFTFSYLPSSELGDTYIIESTLVGSAESTGTADGKPCTRHVVSHMIYRIDDKGRKWFHARGMSFPNNCNDETESVPDHPNDPDCPTILYDGRYIANDAINDEHGRCFVDLVVNNELINQMVKDSEQQSF